MPASQRATLLSHISKYLQENAGKQPTYSELASGLGIPPPERKGFKKSLKRLVNRKHIIRSKRGRYRLPSQPEIQPGPQARSAGKSGGKSRAPKMEQGRLQSRGGRFYVQLSGGKQIRVHKSRLGGASVGERVAVRIQEPKKTTQRVLWGEVVASTGGAMDFREVSKRFLRENKLKERFPIPVIQEALAFPEPQSPKGRKDLRKDFVMVIDPKGARDHDDALGLEPAGGGSGDKGWVLTVHIADVSEYVKSQTPLDREALKRAFTNYLPWMSVPMLPERLSGDLCSLRVGVDRFALSCRMTLDSGFNVRQFDFFESLIHVDAFYTYEEANELAQKKDTRLQQLATVARGLRQKRISEGTIDFELPEPVVELNDAGEPCAIRLAKRVESYQWIEECMLLANRCTARYLKKHKLPGIHRIHEEPDTEDVDALRQLASVVQQQSHRARADAILPVRELYGQLLDKARVQPNKVLGMEWQRQILRSMKKAQYSIQKLGHFALGWKDYAHFTSPIRRYADLWNHRLIKRNLSRRQLPAPWKKEAGAIGDYITEVEGQVQKTERKGIRSATAWVLRDRVGEVFEGVINGLDTYGMFILVETRDLYGEGWLALSNLTDDYYELDKDTMRMVGKRRKRTFKLGDVLTVRLESTDPVGSKVDFTLVRE